MGAGSSFNLEGVPESIDKAKCRELLGKCFDEDQFEELADDGHISKGELVAALVKRTDCFLTHDWGNEDGVDNHGRVRAINEALKTRGIKTWFDEEKMEGNIKKQMVSGIDNSACVVAFITKRYCSKVKGDNCEDNCQLEFNYSSLRKTGGKMIAVVMEERMRTTKKWGGEVAMVLGGRLYVDFAGDFNEETYFNSTVDKLYQSILQIIGCPIGQLNLGSVEPSPAPAAAPAPELVYVHEEAPMEEVVFDFASALPPRDVMNNPMPWTPFTVGSHNAAGYTTGWVCDLCSLRSSQHRDPDWVAGRYHSAALKGDICKTCYEALDANNPPVDSNGHQMPYTRYKIGNHNKKGYATGWICDHCKGRSMAKSAQWVAGKFHCPTCNADLCINCAEIARTEA